MLQDSTFANKIYCKEYFRTSRVRIRYSYIFCLHRVIIILTNWNNNGEYMFELGLPTGEYHFTKLPFLSFWKNIKNHFQLLQHDFLIEWQAFLFTPSHTAYIIFCSISVKSGLIKQNLPSKLSFWWHSVYRWMEKILIIRITSTISNFFDAREKSNKNCKAENENHALDPKWIQRLFSLEMWC